MAMFRRFDFEGSPVLVQEPEIRDPETASPLVLFLHGSGERGVDEWSALGHGLPAVAGRPEVARVRIAVPQCPPRWALDRLGRPPRVARRRARDCARRRHWVQHGGRGAWALALRHPALVLRLSPIAGRLPPETTADELARALPPVPTWVIHGRDDERVPVSESDAAVTALAAIGRRPRYTRYEGLSHGATSETA
jgi:predicted peptidase